MSITITLMDEDQNYIYFDIENEYITEVRPARLNGWKGTRVNNILFKLGERLDITLHKGYRFKLRPKIINVRS